MGAAAVDRYAAWAAAAGCAAAPAGAAGAESEARSGPGRNSAPQITAPAPSLTGMSLIHGYTTGFWVGAAIFGAGAVICGALFRPGPLRASDSAPAAPAGAAAQPAAAAHAA